MHKKSIKFLKTKKYKNALGQNHNVVKPFILPKEYDIDEFKKLKKQFVEE